MGNNGQAAGGFDTLGAARAMEAAGVERRQAEGIAMTMRDAVTLGAATKADVGDVKTELKEDIADVRREVAAVKAELKEDIADVRREVGDVKTELKEDIAGLRTELKADMANLEIRLMKVILAVAGGQAALIVALLKLL